MHWMIRISTVAVALAIGASCDSTVGLDPTRPTFTKGVVPGACPSADSNDLRYIDLSLLLLDINDAILPDDRLSREIRPVSELLTPENFSFNKVDTAAEGQAEPAFVEGENSGVNTGVTLLPEGVSFQFTGGAERVDDDKLVLFLMDYSGSLIGQDPITGNIDRNKATDFRDQRISFFRQLLGDLPESWYVSLVSFNGGLPNITSEYSTPTRNRDVIDQGLGLISSQEGGTTPLADAIEQSFNRIIADERNSDLNPIIVLFTDGVEGGDASASTLAEVKQRLLAHSVKVPIIVLELQPPVNSDLPRGRNPELMALACETGGEYIFLERADEFTESTANLNSTVLNRLTGVWKLRTQTTMAGLDPDGYLLSTELGITLGTNTRSVRLAKARNGNDFNDTRLWFTK